MLGKYVLVVLHKLEHSFACYDLQSGAQLSVRSTREFPHEICLSPDRSRMYVAEMGVRGIESQGPGGHTIAVFDTSSCGQISTIDTGEYDRPHGVATFGHQLYVTSESTRHLLVYDLDNEELIKAVHLDQDCAHMVGINPGGSRAYTANIASNSLTEVDTAALEVVRQIPVPERPEGMAFSPDGKQMFCVCREAKCIAVVDCGKGSMLKQIETGRGPVRIAITPDGKKLAIPLFHAAAVEFVDTASLEVTHHMEVGPHPAGTCISPDGRLVFISCEDENRVYVFDLDSMSLVRRIRTGKGADAMVCLMASELDFI